MSFGDFFIGFVIGAAVVATLAVKLADEHKQLYDCKRRMR